MQVIMRRHLKKDKRGVSNIIVVVLSLIIVVVIVANVILWSYQMNQLDWEKMQENVSIENVTRVTSASYNPSGYTLGGSTQYVSGALSDLQSNNGVYTTFRSYGSASSTGTPITNMNFTSNSSGWTCTEVDAKDFAYDGGWQSSGGNTLGSGGGCHRVIYNDTSSNQPSQPTTDIMRITYSFTTPSTSWYSQKASFAWKYSLDSGSYTTQTLTAKAKLLDATDTVLETLYSTTIMQTSWQYQTNLAIASPLSTSTTYKLQLEFSIVNGDTGNKANIFKVSIYWDDAGVKFTYYSEYTMEVEFAGTSNAETWTQLVWTIDNAWTAGNVSVTLQLHNYTLGDYPTIGNGYISYTSSATPNTDETKNQTITTNPTHFRDASGNWKMKIKGVKSTNVPFDSKVDWVEFKPAIDGTRFTFKNKGALTSRIVSLWIINSTYHQRYSVDIFLNSGKILSYFRADISLPNGQYVVKIVTERGDAAVYSEG